jgi:hypothetical protein
LSEDDASASSDQLRGSPELVPIPLGQENPVLITLGMELRPITPPQPEDIVVSGVLDEDEDKTFPAEYTEEDAILVPEEQPVSTAAIDSTIPEVPPNEVDHKVEEPAAPELSSDQQVTDGRDVSLHSGSAILQDKMLQEALVNVLWIGLHMHKPNHSIVGL